MTNSQLILAKIMKYAIIICITSGLLAWLFNSVLKVSNFEDIFTAISVLSFVVLFFTFIAFLVSLVISSKREQ